MISNIENIMSDPKRQLVDKRPSDALLPKEPLAATDVNVAS